jgi:flagellar motor switch/type III secretory pathway protein FliN
MTGLPRLHPAHVNLRRLLAAVGSAHAADDAPKDVARHDWRSPRYFNEDQYNRLAAVISQVAAVIGGRLAHFFNSDLSVTPASIAQRFAGGLSDSGTLQGRYFMTLGPGNGGPCGFLGITCATATRWVRRLLGDAEATDNPSGSLSPLEESLLTDLVAAVMESFLAPLRVQQDLRGGEQIITGDPGIRFEPAQEVRAISFTVAGDGWNEPDEMLFVLPCSVVAPLVGRSPRAIQPVPPEELSRILMEHIQKMPVTVTVRLGGTTPSVEELFDLDRDDILLLDKPLDEPVELLVEGRTVFRGRPAQAAGRCAFVVTESAAPRKPAKPAAVS